MPKLKTRKENLLLLDTYEATTSASRNVLMSTVKEMYGRGAIRALSAAESLIKHLQNNQMKKFDESFSKLEVLENTKTKKAMDVEVK